MVFAIEGKFEMGSLFRVLLLCHFSSIFGFTLEIVDLHELLPVVLGALQLLHKRQLGVLCRQIAAEKKPGCGLIEFGLFGAEEHPASKYESRP